MSLDGARRPAQERRQLALRPSLRVALERLAGREHDPDHRGGERLVEQESAGDRQDRDEVDAELSMREIAEDSPCQPDRDDDGRDRQARSAASAFPAT